MAQARGNLDKVRVALDFLEDTLASDERKTGLEEAKSFEDVAKMAAEQGYEIDHTSFAEAMKIHVDQSLERSGIPGWIRYRVHAPVHD